MCDTHGVAAVDAVVVAAGGAWPFTPMGPLPAAAEVDAAPGTVAAGASSALWQPATAHSSNSGMTMNLFMLPPVSVRGATDAAVAGSVDSSA